MFQKFCPHCRETKPVSAFAAARSRKDGLSGWCLTCNRVAGLSLYVRRREIMRGFKAKPCADCGRSFPPFVMDFDHRNPPDKKFCIAENYLRLPLVEVIEEIRKCDVVCANCHRIRTYTKEQHRHLEADRV